ncbi:MAG: tetratricopeptide repeat protein [Anaerolineae bacterium]|nr:tetratricopeptide repeat protein [Anaerolineae bacterium]
MSGTAQCDICGVAILQPDGYLLTTAQVAGSPSFWRDYYERHRDRLAAAGISSYQDLCQSPMRHTVAAQVAGEATTWLVCKACIHHFTLDHDQARVYAHLWWENGQVFAPPGAGPAPLSMVRMEEETPAPTPGLPKMQRLAPVTLPAVPLERGETGAPTSPGTPLPPLAAGLLNLTGLGLGYLYLRRWWRWLIHFLIFAGLLAVAWWHSGLLPPAAWWTLTGCWLLWMAVDGWRLARREQQPFAHALASPSRPPLAVAVSVALILLVAEAAALTTYAFFGQQEKAAGLAAYQAADCRTALQHLTRTINLYKLAPTADVAAAEGRRVECSLLVFANNVRQRGEYAIAVTGYEAHLDRYPRSKLVAAAREAAATTYVEWANALRDAGDYQAAMGKYRIASIDYGDTPAGKQAEAQAAETYTRWAAHLRQEGKYQQAIEQAQIVEAEFSATEVGREAASLAAEVYGQWATELRDRGEYEAAIQKYDIILADYAHTPAGQQAPDQNAATYDLWARQLHQAGDYQGALDKYRVIEVEYRDTPAGAAAPDRAAETLAAWATHLSAAGEYQAAIDKYHDILAGYAETAAGKEAATAAAALYCTWAASLHAAGDYQATLEKYQAAHDEFPDTPPGREARALAAETLHEWAQTLRAAGEYAPALDRYEELHTHYLDLPVAEGALHLAAETLAEWAGTLRSAGKYEQASEKYRVLLDEYPDTTAGAQAAGLAADSYVAWAGELLASNNRQRALELYQIILTHFPDTPAADQARAQATSLYEEAEAAISAGQECDALPLLRDLAAAGTLYAAEAKEALPGALYRCGLTKHQAGSLEQAASLYTEVIEDYATTAQAERAQAAQQALDIDKRVQAALDGPFEEREPLAATGSAPSGTAVVVIANDSQAAIDVLFGAQGPNSRATTIEACPTCTSYQTTPLNPRSEAPEKSVKLAPGVYTVVVIRDDEEPLVIRAWKLQSGKEYAVFFYRVSTFLWRP